MEVPGPSLFGGGSLHLDGIQPTMVDNEEEEEEEEEEARRQDELQGLLANAFDDLEDESFLEGSNQYSVNEGGRILEQVLPTNENRNEYRSRRTKETMSENSYQREIIQREEISQGSLSHPLRVGDSRLDSDGCEEGSVGSDRSRSVESCAPWSDLSGEEMSRPYSPLQAVAFSQSSDLGNPIPRNTADRDYGVHQIDGISSYNQGSKRDISLVDKDYEGHRQFSPLPSLTQKNIENEVNSNINKNPSADNVQMLFLQSDSSYDQLQLLYEARGREIDTLNEQIERLQATSDRDVRILKHQINLLTNEKEGSSASANQLGILLTEKEVMIKRLSKDIEESTRKLQETEREKRKALVQLETAENTISSLEYQVAELQAIESLKRNRQMHDDFVKKLRQTHQEETSTLQERLRLTVESFETLKQETEKLRQDLKSSRNEHDQVLLQKSEHIAKLSSCLEELQKQQAELLSNHAKGDSVEMSVKIKKLEQEKEKLENHICTIENELKQYKEQLSVYEMAVKLEVLSTGLSEDDSMNPLGIKRTLNFEESYPRKAKATTNREKLSDKEMFVKVKDELQKSLVLNKTLRMERDKFQEILSEKQRELRKASSDVKSAKYEVNHLREQLQKACINKSSSSDKENMKEDCKFKAENSSLKEELVGVYQVLRELTSRGKSLNELVMNIYSNNVSSIDHDVLEELFSCLQGHTTALQNSGHHFDDTFEKMRKENSELQAERLLFTHRFEAIHDLLEKILQQLELDQLEVASSSMLTAVQNMQSSMEDLKTKTAPIFKENSNLRDHNWSLQLEIEKLKDSLSDTKAVNKELENQLATLMETMESEKKSALENWRDSYLKFHDEAMATMESSIRAEYASLIDKVKEDVGRLSNELNVCKELYISVCREKDALEKKLEQVTKETKVVDNGRDYDSHADQYRKEIEVLKQKHEIEMNELRKQIAAAQKEESNNATDRQADDDTFRQMKIKCQHFEEEILKLQSENIDLKQDLSKATAEKAKLEEIKKQLCVKQYEKNTQNGEGSESVKNNQEMSDSIRDYSRELQKCLLESKREMENYKAEYEVEKAKIIEQHAQEIQKLKENINRNRIREEVHKETAEALHEDGAVKSNVRELQEEMWRKEDEHGAEMNRLTEMVLGAESDIREKEMELKSVEEKFLKYVSEMSKDQALLREELQATKIKCAWLSELETKYNAIKAKYKKFEMYANKRTNHYKSECARISKEHKEAKDRVCDRAEEYFYAMQAKCASRVEEIITMIKLEEIENISEIGNVEAKYVDRKNVIKALQNLRQSILVVKVKRP